MRWRAAKKKMKRKRRYRSSAGRRCAATHTHTQTHTLALRQTQAAGASDGNADGFFFVHSRNDCRPPNHTGAATVTTTDLGALRHRATGEVVPPDGLFLPPFSVALSCCCLCGQTLSLCSFRRSRSPRRRRYFLIYTKSSNFCPGFVAGWNSCGVCLQPLPSQRAPSQQESPAPPQPLQRQTPSLQIPRCSPGSVLVAGLQSAKRIS